MKLIQSVVRPSKFDELKSALCAANVIALTVAEVVDHASENAYDFPWRGHVFKRNDRARFEIRVVVHDEEVDDIVALIGTVRAHADSADGYIAVMPVDHRYNIHSGCREVT